MRSTLVSILLYLAIIWSTSFLKLWNNLAKPLGSFIDESNDFISATKLANKSPTSPVDLVLTSSKIESENSLILLWALAPYCNTWVESITSTLALNSSTACFSASDNSS